MLWVFHFTGQTSQLGPWRLAIVGHVAHSHFPPTEVALDIAVGGEQRCPPNSLVLGQLGAAVAVTVVGAEGLIGVVRLSCQRNAKPQLYCSGGSGAAALKACYLDEGAHLAL